MCQPYQGQGTFLTSRLCYRISLLTIILCLHHTSFMCCRYGRALDPQEEGLRETYRAMGRGRTAQSTWFFQSRTGKVTEPNLVRIAYVRELPCSSQQPLPLLHCCHTHVDTPGYKQHNGEMRRQVRRGLRCYTGSPAPFLPARWA